MFCEGSSASAWRSVELGECRRPMACGAFASKGSVQDVGMGRIWCRTRHKAGVHAVGGEHSRCTDSHGYDEIVTAIPILPGLLVLSRIVRIDCLGRSWRTQGR